MKRKIKFQKAKLRIAKIVKKLEIEMRYVKKQLKRKINKKSLPMEKINVQILQTQKGITLLVLVITIIVLLILAGITIGALTGENGIINNTKNAKEETEIANEKEIVEKATVEAMGKNKYGNIKDDELQNALNNVAGKEKTKVSIIRKKRIVEFVDTQRMYRVDDDGNVYEYTYTDLPVMESGSNFNTRMDEYKANILTVTVLDNMNIPENVYQIFDVSKEQNETVKAWLVKNIENTDMYDLYIGGNDGVDIENCNGMFSYFLNCAKIDLENLYTDKVKYFTGMFSWDTNLKEINLENMNTSNGTMMNTMFNKCLSLSHLDVSNFDTSNVTNMAAMFYNCGFSEINLSNFNTSNVTSMNEMFRQCNIEILDLSSFDTSNLQTTNFMFYGCSNLKTIYVSDKWTNNKVTSSDRMFNMCNSLVGKISYDSTKVDITYANYENGYFTLK